MRGIAQTVAIALAGSVAAMGAAAQTRAAEIVEIAAPDKVHSVTFDSGEVLVHTGSGHPFAVQVGQGGVLALKRAGALAHMIVAVPNLLPQSSSAFGRGRIRSVWLSDATDRYRHGVLGDRLEGSALRARLDDGTVLVIQAGEGAVFEDLRPRLADLDGDGLEEIIVVKSYLDRGAALAVIGLNTAAALTVLAETPPIGRSNRWLNPVGAADFDGDGAVEIAYVETPHIGGRLMVWEWREGALVREHAESGFSNHAIGSTELGLSAIADLDGDGLMDIAAPGRHRDRLRVISLAGGVFREIADVNLGGTIGTAIVPLDGNLIFGLEDGKLFALRFAP